MRAVIKEQKKGVDLSKAKILLIMVGQLIYNPAEDPKNGGIEVSRDLFILSGKFTS